MSISKKIGSFLNNRQHIGILMLRLFIGARLVYGVVDNIMSWNQMNEFAEFLKNFDFPFPLVSAILSVYAQFICGLFILLGYKIRLASFIMVMNFIIALLFVHLRAHDSIDAMTPALAMLFGALTLLFTGPDKLSVSNYLQKNSIS